ncbi:MAG: ABC transporter permease subunit [Thermoplasmatota archaeon]
MNVSFLYPISMTAKKEIMDNIRNKWIIFLSIIFALLTLVASYFGSIGRTGWQDIDMTIEAMMSLVQLLIPIIALMLGYAAIIGEIQKGSMSALLAQPVTRIEIVLGKFIGLGSVLAFTILIGFGIAGIIIAINVADVNFVHYTIFMISTIIIGLVFLSMALFFSTVFKKRSTAMGSAIFLWFFFNMILPLITMGLLVAALTYEDILNNSIPSWFHIANLLNPLSTYTIFNQLSLGISGTIPNIPYPNYYNPALMMIILLIWIITFLLLSCWRFKKREI